MLEHTSLFTLKTLICLSLLIYSCFTNADNPDSSTLKQTGYYVIFKSVEKNTDGGFRPKWILVNADGSPVGEGRFIQVVETRTMRHAPEVVITRHFTGTVAEGGRLTFNWHWKYGQHQKIVNFKWHLEPVPDAEISYIGEGDELFLPEKDQE